MLTDNAIKFGILKCRDLVELYYGARMVASLREPTPPSTDAAGIIQVLGADPSRIAYEVWLTNTQNAALIASIGSDYNAVANFRTSFSFSANELLKFERSFFTDLDAVCLPLYLGANNAQVSVYVRETFLTPIPVDEMP